MVQEVVPQKRHGHGIWRISDVKTSTGIDLWMYLVYGLDILGGVDLDAGAHGGSDGAGTDILALCSSGLSLDNCSNQGVHVDRKSVV